MRNFIRIGLVLFAVALFMPAFSVNADKPFDSPPGRGDTLSLNECEDLADELNSILPDKLCASCEELCHGPGNNCNYKVSVGHCN